VKVVPDLEERKDVLYVKQDLLYKKDVVEPFQFVFQQ
jgi:hypothetical protein